MSKPGRIPELDFLRFFAAFAVLVYHFTYRSGDSELFAVLSEFSRYGYLGVPLFFMISGFVILWTAQGRSPKQFMVARALRLYPTFWISVGITTLFILCFSKSSDWPTVTSFLANLTMAPGYLGHDFIDGVYWTLAIELKFYALIFFLLLTCQLQKTEVWVGAWLFLTGIGYFADIHALQSIIIFPHGSLFCVGCLAFLVYSSGWTRQRSILMAAAVLLSFVNIWNDVSGFIVDPELRDKILALGIFSICALSLFLVAMQKLSLRNKTLAISLGAMTYPLYLLHNKIGKLLFESLNGWPELLILLAAIALCIGLAYAVTELVERKAVRWISKRRLFLRLAQ